ncbi:DUF1127 domain-containing protein [Aureimonas sp. SK2]|uniref:DUF1127 domain-containing protein n=1 Tax=Aureimonas sp. SK2 TaxID=3015992 RepID=UPI0024438F79|nr:DUF1127 domain-containing protein [Aureimonas sp. SK2]
MAAWLKLWYSRGTIGSRCDRPARIISPWEAALRSLARLKREAGLRRSRRALLDLSDDQLRDIGVTRDEALREGRRSFYID